MLVHEAITAMRMKVPVRVVGRWGREGFIIKVLQDAQSEYHVGSEDRPYAEVITDEHGSKMGVYLDDLELCFEETTKGLALCRGKRKMAI